MKSVTITLESDDEKEIETIATCSEDSTNANIGQFLYSKSFLTIGYFLSWNVVFYYRFSL